MHRKKWIIGGVIAVVVMMLAVAWKAMAGPGDVDAQRLRIAMGEDDGPPGPDGPGGGPDGPGMLGQRMDDMAQQIGLTEAQKTQIEPIQTNMEPKMHAVFEDNSLTQEQKMAKIHSLEEETDKQIKALLTPEQQSKYDAMQAQMRERRNSMPGGPDGPPPPGGPDGPDGGPPPPPDH